MENIVYLYYLAFLHWNSKKESLELLTAPGYVFNM